MQRFGTWEPGPSLGFAWCNPSKMREFQQNGDKIMYQNKVNLIGFLGGDAEVRNANNRSFTTLSIATKSSYKDKKSGQYVAQTEWHRCVVFGKLAEFAATLTKGAHVQIEGQLRSRELAVKNSDFKRRLGNPRRFHPEARPGREGGPGRSGCRGGEPAP
jgi:single-strand DNA-binding protein